MMFRIFRHAAALAGCMLGLAVPTDQDEGSAMQAQPTAAAAGLYECQVQGAGTVFRSKTREG